MMEQTIDVAGILEIAETASQRQAGAMPLPDFHIEGTLKIAVARDEAFCFYYKDNISLLKKMGADIEEFSPVHDERLPEGTDGIILGGGYPELYCRQLFGNETMMNSIRDALESGMPCLAECGGFMYLHREVEDMDGRLHRGIGFIDGRAYRTDKLNRFGYIELKAEADSIFAVKGEKIRGHEFHYFDSDAPGDGFKAVKPVTGKSWKCVNIKKAVMAGFPHLFYHSNINIPAAFLKAAERYRKAEETRWQRL